MKRRVKRHYSDPARAFAICGARLLGEALVDKPNAVTCYMCNQILKRRNRCTCPGACLFHANTGEAS